MSCKLEGKVSNQYIRQNMSGKQVCAKCSTLVDKPEQARLFVSEHQEYYIFHYLEKEHYIYESKSGKSVVYCSDYCRRKHNHRFKKSIEIKEVIRYQFKPDDNRTIEEIVNSKDKK